MTDGECVECGDPTDFPDEDLCEWCDDSDEEEEDE